MASRHVLIVGAPRSGTTLLAAMLGAHPDIALLMEDFYGQSIRILSKPVVGVKLTMPNQIGLYARNTPLIRVLRGGLGIPIRAPRSTLSIADYVELHQATVIGMMRDPTGTTRSMVRRSKTPLYQAERDWAKSVEILDALTGMSVDLALVTFEQLLTQPALTLRRLLAKLMLDYDARVLDGYMYTPQYSGHTGIDTDKVRNTPEVHDLLRRDNELASRYQALTRFAHEQACAG